MPNAASTARDPASSSNVTFIISLIMASLILISLTVLALISKLKSGIFFNNNINYINCFFNNNINCFFY